MEINTLTRQEIINSLLDRMNNGEKLTEELINLLTDMANG
jgi:ribosome assembly protein YihI (activator of Der GTPase)